MSERVRESEPLRIGLLWHSTRSSNLGVGALTVANLAIVRHALGRIGRTAQFTVIEMGEQGRVYVDQADVDHFVIDSRSMLSPRGYWKLLDRLDCLLDIGGGDSFAQIYGPKRFGFLWLSKALAILRGRPLLLSPQTLGPFTSPAYRRLAEYVCNRAKLVVARDPMSMAALRRFAPRARMLQSVDVAFALPYDPPPPSDRKGFRVGINVSGMLFNESVSGRNRYGLSYDYAALVRRLLARLTADPSSRVELICHVVAPNLPIDDDWRTALLLADEFPAARLVPAFESPSAAKSYIAGLDFLIAGRMHACIAAFSSHVPFAATAYSRKFEGLFGMLGFSGTMPWQGIDLDSAEAFVLRAIAERARLGQEIERGMREVGGLLGKYEDALVDFLGQVERKR